MQPQDPMFDFYRMLMERNQVDIPGAFMRGQAHAAGLAESKSRLATDALKQREAQLQLNFLPEQQRMQQEEFGMNKQTFSNQQELFKQGKTLWPYQTQNAAVEARMKKFDADHQAESYDFNKSIARTELELKQQELRIHRQQVAIAAARNDTERAKATQDYMKSFNDYSKNAASYAALAAKYRTSANQLLKGDLFGGPPAPAALAQANELRRIAEGYATMARAYNTKVKQLFPELAPTADMYQGGGMFDPIEGELEEGLDE